jgi:hypothetical protein
VALSTTGKCFSTFHVFATFSTYIPSVEIHGARGIYTMSKTPSQSDFQRINLADLSCINDDKDVVERGMGVLRKTFLVVKDWLVVNELNDPMIMKYRDAATR